LYQTPQVSAIITRSSDVVASPALRSVIFSNMYRSSTPRSSTTRPKGVEPYHLVMATHNRNPRSSSSRSSLPSPCGSKNPTGFHSPGPVRGSASLASLMGKGGGQRGLCEG
jgi:hypothetical protein